VSRIVVTGASGFVGRAALMPLVATGHEVHVLSRSGGAVPGCQVHAIDLLASDPARLLADIAPSHALHLAWYAEPGKFWHAPENLDWVEASLRLVRGFAAAGGRRLTLAGSCAEYDWSAVRLDEAGTPLRPATLYGAAKAGLFNLLMAAAPGLGLSLAWGRIFFPYGPDERGGRLLADVVDAVRAGRRVATTDGGQRRDFMHVEDVAAALVALLLSPVMGAVNIASGSARPLREIIGRAASLAGDAGLIDWGARARQPGEPEVMEAATTRLFGELGFVPRWTLETGLADMVARRLPSSAASPTG
jgi:nucleoside-diphosphate-sugar epimerase